MKASLLGAGLTIPITDGRFHLGTWQGIWLCEHRDHPCTFPPSSPSKKTKQKQTISCTDVVVLCGWNQHTATRNIVVTIQGMKQDS